MEVPYVDLKGQYLNHREEILQAVDENLKSGQYILGAAVEEFENRFARLCGVKHAIGVANGTESLMISLKIWGLGPGDEVITAPNSWISSASSITHVGATPVFVDVLPDQNINPALIEKAITPKTKALMPVHLTGKMADMDSILTIAQKYDLRVLEDAAQAVGARYQGHKAGSMGHIGSFSLHPLKNLNGAGDGGVLTTNDDSLAKEIRLLRNHGIVDREHIQKWGYNSRLDSLQATILNVRLKYLDQITEARRRNAKIYQERLSHIVECPRDAPGSFDVYHLFVIQTDHREALKKYLESQKIATAIHYPVPIHLYQAAAGLGYKPGAFPVAERQSQRILSLPVHQNLTAEQIHFVCDHISLFLEKYA